MKPKYVVPLVIITLLPLMATAQEKRDATLDEQRICSNQAEKIRAESDNGTSRSSVLAKSHYSKSRNVCYVKLQIVVLKKEGGVASVLHSIEDGFERTTYGTCAVNHKESGSEILTCWMRNPESGNNQDVSSEAAWSDFVDAHYWSR